MAKHVLIVLSMLALIIPSRVLSEDKKKQPEREVVLLLLPSLEDPFFLDLQRGIEEQMTSLLSSLSVHVRAPKSGEGVKGQQQILDSYYENFAQQKRLLKAVLLVPAATSFELLTTIRTLNHLNIPILLLNNKFDEATLKKAGADFTSYVGSQDLEAGKQAATLITECLPQGGSVLLLNGVAGAGTTIARRAGIMQVLQQDQKFKIVERTANSRSAEAHTIVAGLTALGQHFDAIIAGGGDAALGAVAGLKGHDEKKSLIVGFDGTSETQQAVERGELYATIAQDAYGTGKRAIELLEQILLNTPVSRESSVATVVVKSAKPCA